MSIKFSSFNISISVECYYKYLCLYSSKYSHNLYIYAACIRQTISRCPPIKFCMSPGSCAIMDFLISYGSPGSIIFHNIYFLFVFENCEIGLRDELTC